MRLLIYGLNAAPELTGIGKYTGEMASWFAARKHQVSVVTAPPYYPAWSIRSDYRNRYAVERPEPNLTVYRCPLFVPARPTGLTRMAHLASFALSSTPVVLREAAMLPDVVFTVEPTFFGAPSALLAAGIAQAPAWMHVQDFEIDAAFELGLLPARGPVHSLALGLEGLILRRFERVSSISANMVARAVEKGISPGHAVLFPNWVDTDAITPQAAGSPNSFRTQLGLGGKILVLYSGNMGNKQGLEILAPLASALAASSHAAARQVHLLFCGDGAFRPQLETLVAGLPNVSLLPLQPLDRLNDLLNAADIHLLPQRAGAADLVMPSKLTGMLSSGRPVITTTTPGTRLADVIGGVEGSPALGMVTPPDDVSALAAAITLLAGAPELRAKLGAHARAYAVEHLGREQVLRQFERTLLDLLQSEPPATTPKS